MRLPKVAGWLRAGACTGLVCAIAAALVSLAWPDRYVSSALIRFRPRYVPEQALDGRRLAIHLRRQVIVQEALSRSSLTWIIQSPEIDLYARERQSSPMEDVIESIRKQLRLAGDGPEGTIRISFEYPDARKAQNTVRALVGVLVARNERINNSPELRRELVTLPPWSTAQPAAVSVGSRRAKDVANPWPRPSTTGNWQRSRDSIDPSLTRAINGGRLRSVEDLNARLQRSSGRSISQSRQEEVTPADPELPAAEYLEIVDPASLPESSAGPDRYAIAGIGLGAGFLLGVAGFGIRRTSPRLLAGLTAAALAGFVVAGGVSFLLPDEAFANQAARLPFAGLGAAAALLSYTLLSGGRAAWKSPHYGKAVLAGGALGVIAAGYAAYAIPVRYESTAMLFVYAVGSTTPTEDARERWAEITDEVLSRSSLTELVQRPALDLYSGGWGRRSTEEVVGNMRANDLHIGPVSKTSRIAFRISFAYPDRLKAQAVVREIVTRIVELNATIQKNRYRAASPGIIVMTVKDAASLPEEPQFPQSPMTMAASAGAGAGLAWLLAFLRRRPRGQAAAMMKMGSAWGAAGACLAAAIAFAIPDRYVSTAVLRIRPGASRQISAAHVADYVGQETPVILSRSSLAELIQQPRLDLYRGDRARHPMDQVIDRMRSDIRIESAASPPRATAITIAFGYSDRTKTQAVVRELVTKFVDSNAKYAGEAAPALRSHTKPPNLEPGSADWAMLEVLDAASLPEAPVSPPRREIIGGGLLAGLLLGPVMVMWRWRPG